MEKLKAGLEGMRGKLDELESKRDELIARARTAEAQAGVLDAVKEIDLTDPTSELSRFEEKIRREEAKVAGKTELVAFRLDVQFEALEDEETDAEVEARLKELTGGTAAALPTGGSTEPEQEWPGRRLRPPTPAHPGRQLATFFEVLRFIVMDTTDGYAPNHAEIVDFVNL